MHEADFRQQLFQWTVDAISIYGRKFELVPPCPSLPKTRHVHVPSARREVAEVTKLKLSEASAGMAATRQPNRAATMATARKYLPQIQEMRAQGMTQQAIADALQIHQVAVHRILKAGDPS